METAQEFPYYRREQTYLWNYEQSPEPVDIETPAVPGNWTFCGRAVESPLGIPAGPLLNGRWILYYASLGFDVLTYKTVRSGERPCYDPPNLVPVQSGPLTGGERNLPATQEMLGSWAVSFGMPSMAPDVWRTDIEKTRASLPSNKILSVSVVGTIQPGWDIDDLADDYAKCARWAMESGADCIETNFSCPNVSTCDGQLYQVPASARLVAQRVRQAIGNDTPYIIKIGHMVHSEEVAALLDAIDDCANALSMTNSIPATVVDFNGRALFSGQPRGICGNASRNASVSQVRLFTQIMANRPRKLELIGVGGASTAAHVQSYLAAGTVHLATAPMVDPTVGLQIRRQWSK